MCKKFLILPFPSILSATFILSLCSIEIEDARLLMIPQSRHLNHDRITLNGDMEKVIPFETKGQLT